MDYCEVFSCLDSHSDCRGSTGEQMMQCYISENTVCFDEETNSSTFWMA